MNIRRTREWLVILGTAALVVAAFALSDVSARSQSCCGKGMHEYDAATEVTVTGTVEEIVTTKGCCMERTGTHVTVQSGEEVREVALGPSDYLAAQKIKVVKGDSVEVVGSKSKCCCENDLVLARTLKIGDRSFTLRDEKGVPAW